MGVIFPWERTTWPFRNLDYSDCMFCGEQITGQQVVVYWEGSINLTRAIIVHEDCATGLGVSLLKDGREAELTLQEFSARLGNLIQAHDRVVADPDSAPHRAPRAKMRLHR